MSNSPSPEASGLDGDRALARRKQREADINRFVFPTILGLAVLSLLLTEPMLVVYALVSVVILSPSILVHEWGHYRVAKKAGLEVKEFAIGFGKPLLTHVDKDGVPWRIKAIPLGGSVEVAGMTVEQVEEDGTEHSRAYVYAPIRTRLRLTLAGVFMNAVLAWVLLIPVAVYMAPGGLTWRAALMAPVAALLSMLSFVALALHSLLSTFVQWNSDTGSILMMPSSIQEGVNHASATGMPLWVYFAIIVSLLNLSLAIFNTLPLFPLDGFHAMVASLDGLRTIKARLAHGARRATAVAPLRKAQLAAYTRFSGIALGAFVVCLFGRDIIRLALME